MLSKYEVTTGIYAITCSHLDYLSLLSKLHEKLVVEVNSLHAKVLLPYLSILYVKFSDEEARAMTCEELDDIMATICMHDELGRGCSCND